MADKTIEQRVTDVEQRVARVEERVTSLDQEWQNIPDLIETRLRLTDSRVARLSADMVDVKKAISGLDGKMNSLEAKVDALPRILAEMLEERDRRR